MSNKIAIQRIIDLFSFDKEFQFWKIKTKITSIIERFFSRYTAIQKKDREDFIVIINSSKESKIICNGINITPSSEHNQEISNSAMRQYIHILEAFSIIKKSKDFEKIYNIIDNNFLEGNFNFDANLLIERLINNFNTLKKQSKKLFYSILITFLISKSDNLDDKVIINYSRKSDQISMKEVLKYSNNCGYVSMSKAFSKFGFTLEEVYESILKLISKNY